MIMTMFFYISVVLVLLIAVVILVGFYLTGGLKKIKDHFSRVCINLSEIINSSCDMSEIIWLK